MKLADYCKQQGRGAATKLAFDVCAYPADISAWSTGARPVPVKFAVAIENATNKLVTRKELVPDWHLIWPELATPSQATTQVA